jgi:hypothetical protein
MANAQVLYGIKTRWYQECNPMVKPDPSIKGTLTRFIYQHYLNIKPIISLSDKAKPVVHYLYITYKTQFILQRLQPRCYK